MTLRWALVLSVACVGCGSSSDIVDLPPDVVTTSSTSTNDVPPTGTTEITLDVVDRAGYDEVIAKHRGKVILVDFWATWCGPCIQQFPHTVELSRKHDPAQLAVVSVSMDDPGSEAAVLEFLNENEARFDNLLSSYGIGQTGFEAFELGDEGVPHYKIIDRNSVVRHTTNDPSEIDAWLQDLLAEDTH